LIALHKAYQAKGYTTLAISLKYDSLAAIKNMQQSRALPYKLIYDAKGEYAKAFGGVQMIPTHFFISADGKM
jgi:peroxiredoxin